MIPTPIYNNTNRLISIKGQYQQNDISDVEIPTHNTIDTHNIPILTQIHQNCGSYFENDINTYI